MNNKQLNYKWNEEFQKEKYRAKIRFNDYKTTVKGVPPKYKYRITMDNRKTYKELKQKIA